MSTSIIQLYNSFGTLNSIRRILLLTSHFFVAPGPVNISVSPVPLLRDSRGSSSGLSGLLGHSFVIMTFDLCRSVCWEECRRCLPSLRLMVSRWLFLFTYFFQSCVFLPSQASWELHRSGAASQAGELCRGSVRV